MEKLEAIELAALNLLQQNLPEAKGIIKNEYPFHKTAVRRRTYSDRQKMEQFVRDGFVDRYSGQKLVTSMLHNSIKSNWTLEQLGWKLYEAGDYVQYDGLTGLFIKLVSGDEGLLRDDYIRRWYKVSLDFDRMYLGRR